MTRSVAVVLLGCTVALLAACDARTGAGTAPGSSVEFVAANSSTVIVDFARGAESEIDVAKQLATEKCKLFGGNGVVLESLNVVANGKERATFLCRQS
ncbi:MAG: hypothetical protein AB7O80_11420 [Acetobacteraceae bacterium]